MLVPVETRIEKHHQKSLHRRIQKRLGHCWKIARPACQVETVATATVESKQYPRCEHGAGRVLGRYLGKRLLVVPSSVSVRSHAAGVARCEIDEAVRDNRAAAARSFAAGGQLQQQQREQQLRAEQTAQGACSPAAALRAVRLNGDWQKTSSVKLRRAHQVGAPRRYGYNE